MGKDKQKNCENEANKQNNNKNKNAQNNKDE
ncbi:hypothetical protein SAMN05444373_10111 [Thermoclostridium caenicola]|uniref:Uncharacterized protein n=1 Tax=Thermoclostridium caenicola TaxID=659425 RepID=A0A1M6E7N9_9FIRM|nr:hypothetical protein SAMN05444373_10111 [Thermoclostridium caenicola]